MSTHSQLGVNTAIIPKLCVFLLQIFGQTFAPSLVSFGPTTIAPRQAWQVNQGVSAKFFCVSHDAGFYGAQILILHIARHLKEQLGMEVATVLLGDGPLLDEFAQLGTVLDFTSPSWRDKASSKVRRKRRAALKKLALAGYRHALCNSAASGHLVPMLKAEGFKTVALVHELPNLIREFGLQEAALSLGSAADLAIFPADFVRSRFMSMVPMAMAHTAILPQGLFRPNPNRGQRSESRADLLAQLGLDATALLVVTAGSSDRRKGLDLFVQVAASVVRKVTTVHFIWIGCDQNKLALECKIWIESEGLSANVHFLGVLKEPELYALRIAAADLYLLTSREDPFPSVVLDAMTVGVPVVGFAGAGGFESLLEEGAGILVPREDIAAMTDAVCSALTNTEQAAAMGARGKAIIDARFKVR